MNKYKNRMATLLIIQAIITIVHIVLRETTQINENILGLSWHFWLALGFGLFVFYYAFSLCCPNPTCGCRQIFRGWSIYDLRWPENKCYRCGTSLSTEFKNGRPA